MTDTEIIKALECCVNNDCDNCPFEEQCRRNSSLADIVLGLLNRQKAEIKELRKGFTADLDYFASEYDSKIKSEAIKEFADKLDTYIMWHFPVDDPFVAGIRLKIGNLVKEMVGDDE